MRLALPTVAAAQAADRAAQRFEARAYRRQVILPPAVPAETPIGAIALTGAQKEWEVTLSAGAPVTYNSNPGQASSGEDGGVHVNPSVGAEAVRSFGVDKLTLTAGADIDDYFQDDANDAGTFSLGVSFAWTNRLAGWTPYVSYSGVQLCDTEFGACKTGLHFFTGGLKHAFDLTPQNDDKNKTTLTIDLFGGRRESNTDSVEQTRGGGVFSLGAPFRDGNGNPLGAGWSLKQSVTFVRYTKGSNHGRDDVNLKTNVGFSFTLNSAASLNVGVQFEKNLSDSDANDYKVWDVGPAISLQRTF